MQRTRKGQRKQGDLGSRPAPTCNECDSPVKILQGRCIQVVHCRDVEVINANFLQGQGEISQNKRQSVQRQYSASAKGSPITTSGNVI